MAVLSSEPESEYTVIEIINVADLKDPYDSQGRSYRQVNAAKTHSIPLGAIVEIESGERLYVKRHARDCDQTPLYSIGMLDDDDAKGWNTWQHGYCEDSLTVVQPSQRTGAAP